MRVLINGKLFIDNYDRIHSYVNEHSSNGIGGIIKDRLSEAIQNTEWYQHAPNKMDLFKDWSHVQSICGDYKGGLGDGACYLDSMNWSIMNKTELTADIYKFISDRMAVMREGIQDNLIPNHHLDFGGIFNLIDWHFVLDCIGIFF
jgi:hypothetical protein